MTAEPLDFGPGEDEEEEPWTVVDFRPDPRAGSVSYRGDSQTYSLMGWLVLERDGQRKVVAGIEIRGRIHAAEDLGNVSGVEIWGPE